MRVGLSVLGLTWSQDEVENLFGVTRGVDAVSIGIGGKAGVLIFRLWFERKFQELFFVGCAALGLECQRVPQVLSVLMCQRADSNFERVAAGS